MLFDPSSPSNKFGYYKAGKIFKSYSQFETQEYAAKTGDTVEWNFNDEFFSTIDWTVEPTESLKELYAERARQIRNKYDYLVLSFSGGSDSHNILSTFYENNIYIDEILTYHFLDGVKDKFSPSASMLEVTMAAVPEAKKYIEKFPTTIHRIVDGSDIVKNYWQNNIKDLKFNFMYYGNFYVSPSPLAINNLPTILPEYQKLTDSGKQVCFIHGTDKPFIEMNRGQWSFSFHSDVIGASFSTRRQFEKTPVNDEFFYWDPAAWKIVVKQAHVLRKYLYKNHEIIKKAMTGKYNSTNPAYLSRIHFLGNQMPMIHIKNAIYPYWRNDIVDTGKEAFNLLKTPKASWWTSAQLPGVNEYTQGINYLAKQIKLNEQKPIQTIYHTKKYHF
jgi:hypothetical protein